MKINKLITLGSSMVLTASALAVVLLHQNVGSTRFENVMATAKTFTFDSTVGSNWSSISAAGQVETSVSDPIVCSNATLHTEDEKNFNYGGSGCFYEQAFSSNSHNTFIAGVNNLTSFEFQAHYNHNNVEAVKLGFDLYFYDSTDTQIGYTNGEYGDLQRDEEVNHKWEKSSSSITGTITKVKFLVSTSGYASTDFCSLFMEYITLCWSC